MCGQKKWPEERVAVWLCETRADIRRLIFSVSEDPWQRRSRSLVQEVQDPTTTYSKVNNGGFLTFAVRISNFTYTTTY